VTALALVTAPFLAGAAFADVAFADTSQTVSFGSSWGTQINLNSLPCTYCSLQGTVTFSYTGPHQGTGTLTPFQSSGSDTATAYLSSYSLDQGATQLTPGKYVFSISFALYGQNAAGSNHYELTITPAAIGTDLRVVSDPQNPQNAVISSMLTGDYVNSIGGESDGPPLPAGTWHLAVQDASSKTVFTQDSPQSAGGPPYISTYWIGVTGGPYTASASFAVDSTSASNFSVSGASNLKFAPNQPSTIPSPRPSAPSKAVNTAHVTTVPLWTLLVGAVLVIALILGALLSWVRSRRETGVKGDSHSDASISHSPADAAGGGD
jgi:hypothetical protein